MIASGKDVLATVLAGASVAVSAANVAGWGWPLTDNTRTAAGAALVLGVAACAVGAVDPWSQASRPRRWHQRVGAFLGGAAGIAAMVAIITGWVPALVVCTISTAVLWLITTSRHVVTRAPVPA